MKFLTWKFVLVFLFIALFCWEALAQEYTPNIIFFIADDMGYGDSKIYNPDSKIPTPNLDKLAKEGMVFTDVHTPSALCAPTRYSAMTGNYVWRGRHERGSWRYTGGSQILADQWTVAEVLQKNGYHTAFIGKYHLAGDFYKKNSKRFATLKTPQNQIDFARGLQNGPLNNGFNYSFLLLRGIQSPPYAYFENDQLVGNPEDLLIWKPGTYGNSRINQPGIGMPYYDSSEAGPILTQKAIEFIDWHHQKNLVEGTNTPFFLYFASQSAHLPYTPPELFHGEPVKGITKMTPHTDMIFEIDVALGKLIDSIEQRALTDNTLIIFTSDNGGITEEISHGHDASGGLRGQKKDIWEGGHRVPFIAKWGDGTLNGSVIQPGTTSNQLIGVHDLTATLAEIVGESLPINQARDSFSFLPVLLGLRSDAEPVRDHIIVMSAYNPPHRFYAIRVGQWKLILDDNNRKKEVSGLYNLAVDLSETNNLMDDPGQAERIELMRNKFIELRSSTRTAPGGCNRKTPTIIGTEGHDVIVGTDGSDVISGLGGNDVIYGKGGDDIICGGNGNDSIYGGAGNDKLYGEEGHDILIGLDGNDVLRGGWGNDTLKGGTGDDKLYGGGLDRRTIDNNDTCYDTSDKSLTGCEMVYLIGADAFPEHTPPNRQSNCWIQSITNAF